MRKLILMRHAKSDWSDESLSDHDRPLNPRGRRSAPLVANYLENQGYAPDVILASSAVRVQQTLELMQATWQRKVEVLTETSLYLASPDEISGHVDVLHDSWSTVLVLGHNPGMSALCGALAGVGMELPTAALGVFQTEAETWKHSVRKAEWSLEDSCRPRDLEI